MNILKNSFQLSSGCGIKVYPPLVDFTEGPFLGETVLLMVL